jgi:hypothetical protein
MLAAAAAVALTPDLDNRAGLLHRLQGHAPCPPAKAVLLPLGARAVVVRDGPETVAIAAVDVIGLTLASTRRVRDQVGRRCGIAPERVMLCASHTHCAPATLSCLGVVPEDAWLRRVEAALVEMICDAASNLEPVRLGLGCGSAYFNINRRPIPGAGTSAMARNFAGVVDRRVRVLRLERPDGSTVATLFHYACHPTTKSGSEGWVSPDFPGVARSRIEARLGGRALFIPGCFGNVRPDIVSPQGGFTSATSEQLDAVGRELAGAVERASVPLRCGEASGVASRVAEVTLPFGEPMPRAELERLAADTQSPTGNVMSPWAKRMLESLDEKTLPARLHSEVQLMRIGPVALAAIGGEPVLEIGQAIEKSLRPKLSGVEDVWATGYTNDMVGYLCTDRHYAEGGYEPTAYPWFDQPLPFKDEENTLVTAMEKLAGGL